jgi:uncharacterized Zn-binding protein involved in type VI secretion
MGVPAAKQGDQVTALDLHLVQPPAPGPPVPTPHPFTGIIDGALSPDVKIMGMPAATVNSTASATPPHVPIGGTFVKPPPNRATIIAGSPTVLINGKAAARSGDSAMSCNDPVDLPVGSIVSAGTVVIG